MGHLEDLNNISGQCWGGSCNAAAFLRVGRVMLNSRGVGRGSPLDVDLTNISGQRWGGSCTAAAFLRVRSVPINNEIYRMWYKYFLLAGVTLHLKGN